MAGSEHLQPGVRRAESFDEVADLYDAARPGYPDGLVTDLIELAGLPNAQRILEIGGGTGQLTVPLARLGLALVAIERGPNLGRLLKRNVSRFPQVTAVIADFDEWYAQPRGFDAIVAATAFHWLNPATRVRKCASLLRPGGALVIVQTHWGAGVRDDRFARESQACYARWDPRHDPSFRPPGSDDLPLRNEELERSGFFTAVEHRRHYCRREYTAGGYRDLLSTFSNVLAFDGQSRRGFLDCMSHLIADRFGGSVVRTDVHDLWVTRTPMPPTPG